MPKDESDHLELLYGETAKVAAVFWEWRHKVMTGFFTAIPALLAVTPWLHQHREFHVWPYSPLVLGGVLSIVAFCFDWRTEKILLDCFRVCEEIEVGLWGKGAIFEAIHKTHKSHIITFTHTLQVIYLGSAIGLLSWAYWHR